jgi:hypothetical protein
VYQGCCCTWASVMRCAGSRTRMRRTMSRHSGEACRSGGKSYCTEKMRCRGPGRGKGGGGAGGQSAPARPRYRRSTAERLGCGLHTLQTWDSGAGPGATRNKAGGGAAVGPAPGTSSGGCPGPWGPGRGRPPQASRTAPPPRSTRPPARRCTAGGTGPATGIPCCGGTGRRASYAPPSPVPAPAPAQLSPAGSRRPPSAPLAPGRQACPAACWGQSPAAATWRSQSRTA